MSKELSIEQAEKLKAQVGRHVQYYNRLVDWISDWGNWGAAIFFASEDADLGSNFRYQ